MRKALRLSLAAVVVAIAAAVSLAAPASAYQVGGSTWTWHQKDDFAVDKNGVVITFQDRIHLERFCGHFDISGFSGVNVPGRLKVDTLRLVDEWKVDGIWGNASATLTGPGVTMIASSNTLQWDTTLDKTKTMSHHYDGPSGGFAINGHAFGQIAHTVTAYYRIGGAWYHVQKRRNEHTC